MHANQFSWLLTAIGRTSSSDAHMARRCVGWAITAIMCLIWELDMADWLGSRTQPKYLCCTSSVITPGPNKHFVIDMHTLAFICARNRARARSTTGCTLTIPVSKRSALTPCCSTLSVSSVASVCRSDAAGCIKGECDRAARTCTQAHTAELTLSCKRDDTLLNPCGGVPPSSTACLFQFLLCRSVYWLAGGLPDGNLFYM